ncbi:etoposide-induced protein 2.4-domain-containing protein [Syncephalis fuscata]|nr:etoposide-induced protein 2.4-domain-containing protein [Syncephalis fuscata]
MAEPPLSASTSDGTTTEQQSSTQPETHPTLPLSFTESLSLNAYYAWCGVRDASNWSRSFVIIGGSKTLQVQTAKCFLLNGLIFLGSIYLFEHLLRPSLSFFTTWFVWSARISKETDFHNQLEAEPRLEMVVSWLDMILTCAYQILWVYPIYCLSFFLNSIWYQKVADHAYCLREGKTASAQISFDRLVNRITDEVYRTLLFFNYIIFVSLVYTLPLIGPLASFLYTCWIAAFYCFEYDWINRGWTMDQRMDYFEARWAYFAGFGFPCTAVTFFFPQFVSSGIFALLFPVYVIMSNVAKPVPKRHKDLVLQSRWMPHRWPVFSIAKKMNLIWIRRIKVLRDSKQATSATPPPTPSTDEAVYSNVPPSTM